jgi:ATP-dependent DNA helicase RecG
MRFPATEEQLRVLLEQGEHECLEFKQPGTEDNQVGTVLTKEIRRAALEAATAMLNDMGGKVIIGISPQGEILGVELPAGKYAGLARADALYKWLVDNLSCVRPKPAKFVKPVVVPLQNGRHVIIVHVLRDPQGRPYTYNHESVDRLGSTTQAAEA